MGRDIPFDAKAKCDSCGILGGYDFMGDVLCADCFSLAQFLIDGTSDQAQPSAKGGGEGGQNAE